ncbi:hypothetical protein FDY95_18200 [Hymenobacter jeollabukensis]|uniref:Uncharacterized protein n=2 Tax=Hymenobacter jeollabukensis TaxID=2025313 RepID=A0A5R8WM44_9BACT|nr:hypothetical protein FDY95_18200 [Hymenobacter jeollabukensis]
MSLAELRDQYGVTSRLPVRYDRDSLLLVFAAVEGDSPRMLWQDYDGAPLLDPKAFLANCVARLDFYKHQGHPQYNDITRYTSIKPVLTLGGQRQTFTGAPLTESFLVLPVPDLLFGQADNVTINTLAPALASAQLDQAVEAARLLFNINDGMFTSVMASKLLLARRQKSLYYYWTYPPGLMDGPNWMNGAETFVYRPGVGILTGTYSSYTEVEGHDFKVTRLRRLK